MTQPGNSSFDPIDWFKQSGLEPDVLDLYHEFHGTYGPLDAYACVKVREWLRDYAYFGEGVPADAFILSVGGSDDRARTKIGGLPFWNRNRAWPTDSKGQPIPFLAQFNFSESLDLFPDADGNVLVVFSHTDPSLGCVAHWEPLSTGNALISSDEIPIANEVHEFTGTRWRTDNFPEWKLKDESISCNSVTLANGIWIRSLYTLFEILGMQIGTGGFLSAGPASVPIQDGEEVICSISGLAVAAKRPYRFLNRPEAFSKNAANELFFSLSDIQDCDGFGVLFVLRGPNGDLRCRAKNL